jgi:hypothetical protein
LIRCQQNPELEEIADNWRRRALRKKIGYGILVSKAYHEGCKKALIFHNKKIKQIVVEVSIILSTSLLPLPYQKKSAPLN